MIPELRMQIEMHKLADPETRDIPADQWQMAMEVAEVLMGIVASITEGMGRDLTQEEVQHVVEAVVPALALKKALEGQYGRQS